MKSESPDFLKRFMERTDSASINTRSFEVLGVQYRPIRSDYKWLNGSSVEINVRTDKDPQSSTHEKQIVFVNGRRLGTLSEGTVIPEGLTTTGRVFVQPSQLQLRISPDKTIPVNGLPEKFTPSEYGGRVVEVTLSQQGSNKPDEKYMLDASIGSTRIGFVDSKNLGHFSNQAILGHGEVKFSGILEPSKRIRATVEIWASEVKVSGRC